MSITRSHIRIAVVGAPDSGKSYLLFDLIHALAVLGYRPATLPLDYRHSSFGSFFYEVFDPATGGLRGTETAATRPENHYGAHLRNVHGKDVWIDFINIPGEAFGKTETVRLFLNVSRYIKNCLKLWQADFVSPSGHKIKLVLPSEDFEISKGRPKVKIDRGEYRSRYIKWVELNYLLNAGQYERVGQIRELSGKEMMSRITEFSTDSILLSLRAQKQFIEGALGIDFDDFAVRVRPHFYSLAYCQQATDMVLCDRPHKANGTAQLADALTVYFGDLDDNRPHLYLAFREVDRLLATAPVPRDHSVAERNRIYSRIAGDIWARASSGSAAEELQQITRSLGLTPGSAFRGLLGYAYARCDASDTSALPPHVYFTATPIDADGNIYVNDDADPKRFYHEGTDDIRSFAEYVRHDMTRHGCLGSLQLLTDILWQNKALPKTLIDSIPDNLKTSMTNH